MDYGIGVNRPPPGRHIAAAVQQKAV